jgi:MFS transporter, PPP family, 3-phenylpropionic acid transporter
VNPIRRAALTYAVYFTALGASWAYLPVYYRDLGLGLATIGLLTAFSAGIQLVAAPAWGLLADRYPRSRAGLPAAALVAAVGSTLLALTGGSAALPISVAVMSVGLAGIGPVLDARTLELLGARTSRYGEIRAIGSLVFVLVSLGVGMLLDLAGTWALFVVYVPALLGTAIAGLRIPRGGGRPGHTARRGVGAVIRAPGILAFLGGALLTWALVTAVNSFYSIQVIALGGSPQLVGVVWAIGAAVEVPVMWGHGRLARRIGPGAVLLLGAAAYTVRAALAAASPSAGWLVAISPLEGLGYGLLFPGSVGFIAARAPSSLAATAQGVLSATFGLSAIVGSAVGGIIAATTSIETMFAVAAGGGVAGAVLLALAARAPAPVGAAPEPGPGPASIDPLPVLRDELHP